MSTPSPAAPGASLVEDVITGNIREAVNNVLVEHRSPVYGACSCGWPVPGYPHSNGSAHWRDHIADVIVERVFPPGATS